jgi:hypothetical protein
LRIVIFFWWLIIKIDFIAAPTGRLKREGKVHIPQAAVATPPLHGAMVVKPLQGFGRLRRMATSEAVLSPHAVRPIKQIKNILPKPTPKNRKKNKENVTFT